MDDLVDLDWSAANQPATKLPPAFSNTANYYPSLKPTPPISGRSTPLPDKAPAAVPKASTLQTDSFASLLPSFTSSQTSKNLSLKEQQALLEEQKRQKALNQARQWDSLSGGSASTSASVSRTTTPIPVSIQALNSQTSGQRLPLRAVTPLQQIHTVVQPTRQRSEDVEDILAAFDSSAPVDKSSHFPAPSRSGSGIANPTPSRSIINAKIDNFDDDDDDDPFGLGTTRAIPQTKVMASTAVVAEDDDVLGLLGKPVSELSIPKPSSSPGASAHPVDTAIAELVDMGFPADKAKDALARTESGLDIQAAVGYLLNQAHSESRSRNHKITPNANEVGEQQRRLGEDPAAVAWNRQQRANSQDRAENNDVTTGKEPTKFAAELGNNFFRTANSLWKAGQKKVNKAMADFNTEPDSAQPKWMRDAALASPPSPDGSSTLPENSLRDQAQLHTNFMTDEAALLESGSARPQSTRARKTSATPVRNHDSQAGRSQQQQRAKPRSPQPINSSFTDEIRSLTPQARTRVTREMNEEATPYVSPARRKKTTPQPLESNLQPNSIDKADPSNYPFSSVKQGQPRVSEVIQAARPAPARPATTIPVQSKPKTLSRLIPTISASAIQASTTRRNAGTAAFKLGNYSEAHASYTAAFRDIPKQHPLLIILLTNRALTSLKTGDPKQCIADADQALEIIGPSRGTDETIVIGGEDGVKDMSPYWEKAMMRRAEALEQLERWADAAKVWKECVEAGVGGAQSIQGRARCEKASGTGQAAAVAPKRTTSALSRAIPKPVARSALDELSGKSVANNIVNSEAVERLRAANSAAARLDDERFALTDSVADRVEKWKKGKEQNLRALLGSLDTVLWPDSGWKKIGMGELLNPSKVKINYMKGIAKVHPDKVRFSNWIMDND